MVHRCRLEEAFSLHLEELDIYIALGRNEQDWRVNYEIGGSLIPRFSSRIPRWRPVVSASPHEAQQES